MRLTLALAVLLPLALAACGRAGPLDPPPGTATPAPLPPPSGPAPTTFIDPTTPTGGAQPAPVQTTQANPPKPAPQKSFILDPLIQ